MSCSGWTELGELDSECRLHQFGDSHLGIQTCSNSIFFTKMLKGLQQSRRTLLPVHDPGTTMHDFLTLPSTTLAEPVTCVADLWACQVFKELPQLLKNSFNNRNVKGNDNVKVVVLISKSKRPDYVEKV